MAIEQELLIEEEITEQTIEQIPDEAEAEATLVSGPRQAPIPSAGNSDALENAEDWIAVFSRLPLEGMLKSICGQLSFRTRAGDEVTFDIDPSVSGVLSDKYQTRFAEILSMHLGQNLQVVIESQNGSNESPTERANRLHAEALAAAEAQLVESPVAQILGEAFDAKLVPGSVVLK